MTVIMQNRHPIRSPVLQSCRSQDKGNVKYGKLLALITFQNKITSPEIKIQFQSILSQETVCNSTQFFFFLMNVVMLKLGLSTPTMAQVIIIILNKPYHIGYTKGFRIVLSRMAFNSGGFRGMRTDNGKKRNKGCISTYKPLFHFGCKHQ